MGPRSRWIEDTNDEILGSRSGDTGRLEDTFEQAADRRFLGCLDRVDARWHGLGHLRSRPRACPRRTSPAIRPGGNFPNIDFVGSIMLALFLIGWGLSFRWGPVSDRFGRATTLAAMTLVYALFTGAAALAPNIWLLASFPLPCGNRHRWRVGHGRHLRGRSLARGPPQDGRRLFADRLLLRLLRCGGTQFLGRSVVRDSKYGCGIAEINPDCGLLGQRLPDRLQQS